MVVCKAGSNAKVDLTGSANEMSLLSGSRLLAAYCAVFLFRSVCRVVLMSQVGRESITHSTLAWHLLGWQLCEQLMHQLDSKLKVSSSLVRSGPELEGIDDAHVQKPPC
jgi:hypothetical protein